MFLRRRCLRVSSFTLSTTSSYCLQFSDEGTKAQSGWSPRSHGQEAVEQKTFTPHKTAGVFIPLGLSSWAPVTVSSDLFATVASSHWSVCLS